MELLKRLLEYSQSGAYPMHMPGHKRNPDFLQMPDPVCLDITEINGFDNLHAAEGVLKEAMERAARLWGAKRSYFLVNGSSGGILAALSAALPEGGSVAVDRSAHKSVYHALELRRLRPHYLCRPTDPHTGLSGSVSPAELERLLDTAPDVGAVLITSPTYEGVVSDIRSLSAVAHAHGAVLIVDEAHGAHLGFSPAFPRSAVTEGADVVIQSLHKTLPAFTQSAILHLCSDRVDEARIGKFLAYYQTSSPSYLLMAAMDACVSLLTERREELFAAYEERLARFCLRMDSLTKLRLVRGDSPVVWGYDPGKLYFSLRSTSLTGEAFAKLLRKQYGIEPEMATADGCLCMTSIADTDEGFDRLAEAVIEIDGGLASSSARPLRALPKIPHLVLTPAEAAEQTVEVLELSRSVGRLAGEFVWAYPPDIPLLVPGERIDSDLVDLFTDLRTAGVRLHSDSEGLPRSLCVLSRDGELR